MVWDSHCAGPSSRASLSPKHELRCSCRAGHNVPSPRRTSVPRGSANFRWWCEVNVIARMACQPVPDLFDLVCAVVIHDEMHVQAGRKVVLNLVQKTQELLVTMPPEARADGHAGSYIHCREQRSNSMPLVVMGLTGGHARRQRQNWFGPI